MSIKIHAALHGLVLPRTKQSITKLRKARLLWLVCWVVCLPDGRNDALRMVGSTMWITTPGQPHGWIHDIRSPVRVSSRLYHTTSDSESEEPRIIRDFDGSANEFWKLYRDEAKSHDDARIGTLKEGMESALIFVRSYSVHASIMLMRGPTGWFIFCCSHSIRS
jgi:hypothetical protein